MYIQVAEHEHTSCGHETCFPLYERNQRDVYKCNRPTIDYFIFWTYSERWKELNDTQSLIARNLFLNTEYADDPLCHYGYLKNYDQVRCGEGRIYSLKNGSKGCVRVRVRVRVYELSIPDRTYM